MPIECKLPGARDAHGCPGRWISILLFAATLTGGLGPSARAAEREQPVPEPSQEKATNDEAANHLAGATSPYLLQHVHNPVDWYEWGEEAFAKARDEDLPVFLSIGYAACHWCHVMAHESFESEEVARILNSHFVSIKVDREERPDIDELYMAYTVEATGGGGWPMSVFLTPEGAPFHAGTYYPRPQFIQLLEAVSETWRHEREKITRGAESARNWFQAWSAGPPKAEGVIPLEAVDQTALLLARHFDPQHGGMAGGGTNKFPPSMAMELMLRSYHRTGESDLVTAVETTLDNMARGGIYDHIGGGICRYSTDVEWLVPHFEKMLYDQAMVSSVYLDAYQVSRNPAYSHVAADIFDYVLSDLATEEGGFCSSRDADSDGLEGAYYIWTEEEIVDVLGKEEARLCCDYYDVTASGNWFERFGHAPAGPKNVLRILKPAPVFAREHDMSVEEFETRVDKWRRALAEARSRRTPPGLDDKVLASWNGLMIASLAKGAQVLHEPRYLDAAKKAAAFVTERMMKDGRLFRSYRAGRARYTGYLDDYAFMVAGLLNIFEACGDPAVLKQAKALTDTTIEHFADAKRGGFYFTASDGEALIARSRSPRDGVIPSGNSVMAENLLRLAILVNEPAYRERAEGVFKAFASQVGDSPAAFEHLLCAADFYHDRVKEVVVIGDRSSQDTRDLLNVVHGRYLPNKVVIVADRADDVSPLLEGKAARDGKATAYVCEQYRCQAPTQEVAELRRQLFREP